MNRPVSLPLPRTVLLCGAGAHYDYKMPTGKGLTETLHKMLNNSNEDVRILNKTAERLLEELIIFTGEFSFEHNNSNLILKEFLNKFYKSKSLSIDSYLSNQTDLKTIEIGKLLIALIIRYFQHKTLNTVIDQSWIEFVLSHYSGQLLGLEGSKLSLYTFNYDILFEVSVFTFLVYQHNMSVDDAFVYLKNMNINHFYGSLTLTKEFLEKQLGLNTSWVHHFNEESFKYIIKSDISNIIVMNKNKENTVAKKFPEDLETSQRLFIMGYGYDLLNNAVLISNMTGANNIDLEVVSTDIGLRNPVKKMTGAYFSLYNINIKYEKKYCNELLLDYF